MYINGEPVERVGDAYVGAVPSGLHPCRPGGTNDYVYILLASNRHWESLLRAIEREDLIGDERYSRQSLRNARKEEVCEIVRAWTRQQDKFAAMERISELGVPCGATLDTCELLVNQHLVDSGMIAEQTMPGWGKVRVPACPITIDGQRGSIHPAPALDGDRDEVLGAR
jgi:formyl-CoA transferase